MHIKIKENKKNSQMYNKRRIRRIDSDLDKAIAILNANLEAEIKRNKK